MANGIKIGSLDISAFKVGSSDCKVYLGDILLYPHLQEPCFAVVDNISTYTARTYVDVFNESDGLWYKLNNLNQYEEYGVFGSGRNITYYDGKLTIDGDYEYQYSGSGWNNVGAISGSSRVPAGYSEVEYIKNTGSSYINTTLQLCSATTNTFQVEAKLIPNRIGTQTYQNIFSCMSEAGEPYQGFTYRYQSSAINGQFIPSNDGSFTQVSNSDGTTSVTASSVNGLTYSHTYPLTICCGLDSSRSPFRYTSTRIYTFKVTLNNGIAADYVPTKRDSDSVYGLYDLISDSFLTSPNGNNFVGGSVVTGTTTYPVYYDEIQDPPDNLSFSSMTEAESYECPWVGMKVTIDGDKYIFSGDSQSGYEWVYNPSRLPDGYTEIEYIENTSQAYINLGIDPYNATGNSFTVESTFSSYTQSNLTYLISCEYTNKPYNGFVARWNRSSIELVGNSVGVDTTAQNIPNGDGTSAITFHSDSTTTNNGNTPITLFSGLNRNSPWRYGKGRLYALKMTLNNSVVRELVPAMRDNDSKYGMYDIVNDVFYLSSNSYNFSGGNPI